MKSNGFEFSGFRKPPVEREFLPHEDMKPGEGVMLKLNLDLLTLERMEQLETEFDGIFETTVAKALPEASKAKSKKLTVAGTKPEPAAKISLFDYEKKMFKLRARMLAGRPGEDDPDTRIIQSWNVVADGKAVPVSFEAFLQMPSSGLRKLYEFCTGEANNPTKNEKKVSEDT